MAAGIRRPPAPARLRGTAPAAPVRDTTPQVARVKDTVVANSNRATVKAKHRCWGGHAGSHVRVSIKQVGTNLEEDPHRAVTRRFLSYPVATVPGMTRRSEHTLDVTVSAVAFAEAAALTARLLTIRSPQPVHAAVLLRADDTGLHLSATDGALTVRLRVAATVHQPGAAVVPRRGLAETLAGLGAPEARVVAEGSRLAVRVPSARFALPVLADPWPPARGGTSGAG
ncbi:hypothetical protein, partial [Dactylosporangium fulvum]|uniref:hypothetical protein n=1 Tax=Dactylosporangium fulvum TaxID=53359 RepID=UPI0031DD429B